MSQAPDLVVWLGPHAHAPGGFVCNCERCCADLDDTRASALHQLGITSLQVPNHRRTFAVDQFGAVAALFLVLACPMLRSWRTQAMACRHQKKP